MAARRAVLPVLLVATLVGFGGIHPVAAPMLAAAALLALLAEGGHAWAADPVVRPVQVALVVLTAAVGLQLLPLPAGMRELLSPELPRVEALLRPDALVREPGAAALSLMPRDTAWALAVLVAAAATYQAALASFARGGVRLVARTLAAAGAVVAVAAVGLRAATPGRLYGIWDPGVPGAQPFGPVINRNHLAAWLVMASALAAGYALARLRTRVDGPVVSAPWAFLVRRMAASRALGPATAWVLMATAISLSRSRSGLIALAVALAVLWRGGHRRAWPPRVAAVMAVITAAAAAVVFLAGDVPGVAARFAAGIGGSDISRLAIWRDTLPIIGDFWLTGTGTGTFGLAMVAYQQTLPFAPHLNAFVHFNHAHNHYLQVAAEGGLLVSVPALGLAIAFLRAARRRLHDESGELLWLRLGALAGLAGVGVQSLWEVPLTMPANALLAATLAAITTYRRVPVPRRRAG